MKNNKAILFIHGFTGGIYDYNNFPNELQIHENFDVFTFTLPGHDKAIIKNVKYEEWLTEAENQIKFLIDNNYHEIYLIGHSMGGIIATHLASIYKEVTKLVLVAPAFRYFYFKDGKINIKNIDNTLRNINRISKEYGKDMAKRFNKSPLSTKIEFMKLASFCEKDLEKITCPILTIHGTSDLIAPAESTTLVYNTVKSTSNTLVNIKNIDHNCFRNTNNLTIREIITKFLIDKPNNKKEIINL